MIQLISLKNTTINVGILGEQIGAHAWILQEAGPMSAIAIAESQDVAEGTVDAASTETQKSPGEPPKKKARKPETREPLISKPPELPANMLETAKIEGDTFAENGSVELNQHDQKNVKKALDAEVEKQKKEAMVKKQQEAEQAIEKAKKKLEAAQAKAAKLSEKVEISGKGRKQAKRNLDKELTSASGNTGESALSPVKPKRGRKKVEQASPNVKSPSVKLSPKAKAFASPLKSPKKVPRQNRAESSLQLLRDLNLPDLKLPTENFTKK